MPLAENPWSDPSTTVAAPAQPSATAPIELTADKSVRQNPDFIALANMAIGEAANDSDAGFQGVTQVALNRAATQHKPVSEIVSAPGQFDGYKPDNYANASSAVKQRAADLISPMLNGEYTSPVGTDAQFYYAPDTQNQLHAENPSKYPVVPSFATGTGFRPEGSKHVFFGGNYDQTASPQQQPGQSPPAPPSLSQMEAQHGAWTAPQAANDGSPQPPSLAAMESANGGTTAGPQTQTPGYNKAYSMGIAAQQKAGANDALGALSGSFLHGYAMDTLPIAAGGLSALSTGAVNALHDKLGIGKGAGYSAEEAYNAGRQATTDILNKNQQQHPILSTVGNTAGFLASPVTQGAGALANVARESDAVAALPMAARLAARAGVGAAEGAGTLGAAGVGQGLSDGQTVPQALQSGLDQAKTGAEFGAAGDLIAPGIGKLSALAEHAHPAVRALAAPVASGVGGAIASATPALLSGNFGSALHNAEQGFLWGSATHGIATTVKSIADRGKPEPAPTQAEHDEAVSHLAKQASPEDFESSSAPTTAESLSNPNEALTTASQHDANAIVPLKETIANRQHQSNVKDSLVNNINSAIGGNINQSANNAADQIASERAANKEAARPENLAEVASNGITSATGIKAETAKADYDKVVENKKATIDRKAWEAVDNAPTESSAEFNKLLSDEPVVQQTLRHVQATLGPEGSVPNPNYKQAAEPVTPATLTNDHYNQFFKSEQSKGLEPSQFPQAATDFINQQNGASVGEPETIPSNKARIKTAESLNGQVARDDYGKIMPGSQIANGKNYQNYEIAGLAARLNNLNKAEIPGLTEAKAASGDTISGTNNKRLGYALGKHGEYAENTNTFDTRFNGLSDRDQEATKHGYVQHANEDIEANPTAAVTKYQSPAHQKFQQTMFKKSGKEDFQNTLDNIKNTKMQAEKGGTIERAHNFADAVLNTRDKAQFDKNYNSASDAEKSAFEANYRAKIANTVNDINSASSNVTQQHLKNLQKLTTDEFEQHVQNKIFGSEGAAGLRASIQKQIDLAKSGEQISKFSPKSKAEEHSNVLLGGVLGGMGGHGIVGKGMHALQGVGLAEAFNPAKLSENNLSKGAQKALVEKLTQSPQQTAKDIRDLQTKKAAIPMSKSTLTQDLTRKALQAGAYTLGHNKQMQGALSAYGNP